MAMSIALAGNPNCGKTTLFNKLTGARQHVGNYPGVTVEKKEGTYSFDGNIVNIVDLPGTYSLSAYSEEEVVARDFMVNARPEIINITDASNLERNLYLTVQLLEMGMDVILALNMIDVAKKRNISIDHHKLSSKLGVPVVPIIARSGKGQDALIREAAQKFNQQHQARKLEISYGEDLDPALKRMRREIEDANFLTGKYPAHWTALKYLENDQQISQNGRDADPETAGRLEQIVQEVSDHLLQTLNTYPEAMIADYRYGFIKAILRDDVLRVTHDEDRLYSSDKIDLVATNRIFGPLIMLAVLYGLYQFTFTYSEIPVVWFENFFGWLSDTVSTNMPQGHLRSLFVSGIIDGVGGVLGFVPLIAFMFFGIAILEDSGYLARVAYMLDRVFRIFGLHGSSVMAYIVSGGIAGGCAVPGVMATRTLRSKTERLSTLLTVPFMNCGAKLPVLALLIAAFFTGDKTKWMFVFTLIAWVGALLTAKFLRLTFIRGESTPFVMELPPYRLPTFKALMIHTWERTWQYVKKAGTVILAISVLFWAMMTFPGLPQSEKDQIFAERQSAKTAFSQAVVAELEGAVDDSVLSSQALELKSALEAMDRKEAELRLRSSLAGRIGTSLEAISHFAGFDWRTNIALVGGIAAKEVIVATLGTAYSLGGVDPQESDSLADTLSKAPGWSPLVAVGLIIFTMFYSPCLVSVVCISREAGSWKWGAFSIIFNTILASVLAIAIYQVGSLFGIV